MMLSFWRRSRDLLAAQPADLRALFAIPFSFDPKPRSKSKKLHV